jgi:hypothetical protein
MMADRSKDFAGKMGLTNVLTGEIVQDVSNKLLIYHHQVHNLMSGPVIL